MKACPNCNFENESKNDKCSKCGIIFEKWKVIQENGQWTKKTEDTKNTVEKEESANIKNSNLPKMQLRQKNPIFTRIRFVALILIAIAVFITVAISTDDKIKAPKATTDSDSFDDFIKELSRIDLELLDWKWSQDSGYAVAQGQIKNISEKRLKNVQALVTWYDSDERLITSETSLIEYDPIMPGQISPFKVMAKYNPLMSKATLAFKRMFGGRLSMRKAE